MTEIYVIRHVQAEGNLYRHMQGHWDGDVTAHGKEQMERLAERFRDVHIDAVYSSDLRRARFTARAFTQGRNVPLILDRRLREINIGPWEGEPFANAIWETPALFETFLFDPEHFSLEGAETYGDVQKRAAAALRDIAEANPGRTVAITTHGITIRCMLAHVLGIPISDTETVPLFANTGVAHLRYEDGRFTVLSINDASHLDEGERGSPRDRVSLRHVPVDPAERREAYIDCYADAWRTAHGSLEGFDGDTYWLAALEHRRADPESVLFFYEGERFAGLLDLDTERGESIGVGWISLLYLAPEYRGRGLGVQLLGRAVVKYRRLGRRTLRLQAAEDNAAALAFYRRNGFETLSWTPGRHGKIFLLEKDLRGIAHGDV
ncbi:MAG: GNAT family N-acetyltransferase [Oscillospiraceae bacterium]|nr:GNAT family N-acetyltransferase [Oscillospiraceae bacterium]